MTTTEPVKILIAGGGLAGLLMGLLCQHANISYYIFERSLESKPRGMEDLKIALLGGGEREKPPLKPILVHNRIVRPSLFSGAVMSLNASIFPVFEQLGMMEDLMRISRPVLRSQIMNEDLEEVAVLEIKNIREQ